MTPVEREMTMRSTTAIGIAAVLSTVPLHAQNRTFADTTAIDREVALFTGAAIGADGGARAPVDARLRLAPCRSRLDLSLYGARQDSVAVACPDAGNAASGWRIFVPLSQSEPARSQQLIEKGDRISVVIEGRGFSVVQSGEAVEGGGMGDWIRVQPPGKTEPIRARIDRPGKVVIPLD